jgi:hypothetical protein
MGTITVVPPSAGKGMVIDMGMMGGYHRHDGNYGGSMPCSVNFEKTPNGTSYAELQLNELKEIRKLLAILVDMCRGHFDRGD